MKIASSTWSFHPWLTSGKITVEQLAQKGREMGLEGFEIVDIDLPDTSEKAIREIGKTMADNQMQISCVSLEHDLSQPSRELWNRDIDKVKRWMDYALILGTPKLRVFTGWQKPGMSYLQQVRLCEEGLSVLSQHAQSLGVTLTIENHNDICRFADELVPMIERIGSPNLKTNPDPFNFGWIEKEKTCRVNEMVYEQTRLMMPLAENIHFKFTRFDGDGNDIYMDVEKFMALFKEYGYDGWIAMEFMWPEREANVDLYGEIAKGARLIRKYC